MTRRLPHPLLLLLGGVAVAALFTWLLPAGEYTRVFDGAAGRQLVVPGTYAAVTPAPASPWATLMAVPRGIATGIEVILTVLVIGGAFALLDATGALARLLGALLGRGLRPPLVLVSVSLVCAIGGAAEQMHEEFIALMPVLVVLSLRLGYGAITAVMMSMGAAAVGAAFGPTNPFGTGIALRMAELPPGSAMGLRLALLGAAVALWIAWTLFRARRDDIRPALDVVEVTPPSWRDAASLAALVLPIVIYVWGVLRFDWGFNQLTGMFLVAGFVVGLLQRMSLDVTTAGFIRGMETMLGAGLLVGIARAISIVLTDGRVIDTMIAWSVAPLEAVPPMLAALLMIPVHAIVHIPVPSTSGQAVLMMPIMAPMADLLGFSRDTAVLAFQAGAVMSDLVNPTNGAMLAMLLKAGVPYGRWLRHALPGMFLMWLVAAVGILILR
ncbi:MAG: YfcC family protein [Gemmatimonadaceae bacterium]|nr:YfcC family protein [Gemmatimonadaceae bacterium]MCW5825599.1 YfcC family protein [Gemmatimonadaceae bacterium]